MHYIGNEHDDDVQVHHLSTEKDGENLKIMPKNTTIDTNYVYPITKSLDVKN